MEKFLHKIHKFFDPHYLIRGGLYQNLINLTANLVRSTPDSAHIWHSADSIVLQPHTVLYYLGTVKENHMSGELDPRLLVFEIKSIIPNLNTEVREVSSAVVGDLISLQTSNRRDISPAPQTVIH